VGERQSSAAITTQYANADPVFQVKTAALPSKYAYFRTCRGDGQCGWRGELHRACLTSVCANRLTTSNCIHLL
jgi:hypothetical protein